VNWVDYTIVGVVGLSAVISLVRGFVTEVLSLAIWVLSFWVAWTFFREVSEELTPWISMPSARLGVSFLLLFLVTLILGGFLNFLIGRLVDSTGLSGTDRLLGAVFGLVRGAVLVAALVFLAGLTPLPNDPWWQDSQLIKYFQRLAFWLLEFLPPDIAAHFHYR
jgi:membrane protein required for colicin V production